MSEIVQKTYCANTKISGDAQYIPFRVSNISYMIYTDWYIDYPKKVKTKLREMGYIIPDEFTELRCNWYEISKAQNMLITTGHIDVQIKSKSIFVIPDYNDSVVLDVQNVLQTTYPTTEICMMILFPSSLILIGLVMMCCVRCR